MATRTAHAVLTLSLFVALHGAGVTAQSSTGTISGTVRDETAAAVPETHVVVSGPQLLGIRVTDTDQTGRYRVPDLPPGVYDVMLTKSGFTSVRQEKISLPAGASLVLDFPLTLSRLLHTIVVTGRSPMVDVTSPAAAANIDQTMLRDLPTSRSVAGLINLVPGVSADVAFGGTQQSNALSVDGLDMTEPMVQQPFVRVSDTWLQEVHVAALGAGAEYGGFTGLSANMVLRSGSNRLSGLAEVWTTQPSWVADNTRDLTSDLREEFSPRRVDRWWDGNVESGGPIRRDRVWYFAGFQHTRLEDRPAGYTGEMRSELDESRVLGKVTAALAESVRLEGFVQHGGYRQLAADIGPFIADEATGDSFQPQTSWNTKLTWTLAPRTRAEGRVGGFTGRSEFAAHAPLSCDGPPSHWDLTTNWQSGNVYTCWRDDRSRVTWSLSVSHYTAGAWGMHDLHAGTEGDRSEARGSSRYPGGVSFTDDRGAPYQAEFWQGESSGATTSRVGTFFEDQWQVARRLTLVPGLRLDVAHGGTPDRPGIFATTSVSPRVGASFDVTADHDTVVRVHYGRYYDPVFAGRITNADLSDTSTFITLSIDPSGEWVEVDRTDRSANFAIDPAIRHSHMDQVVVGGERQLAADVSVAGHYIHRHYADFMGLVDTGSQWAAVTRQDPGPDGVAGSADDRGTLTAYSLVNRGSAFYLYTNPPEARRRYDAVQMILKKRNTRAWQAQASYTWSRAMGNVSNRSSANAGYWDLGNPGNWVNPNRLINAYGQSPYDPTHELKILGTLRPARPAGFSTSAVYRFTSGQTWERQVVVRGLSQGQARIRVEPTGSRRLDPESVLDLRIEQAWPLTSHGRVVIYVDALNLMNRGVAESVIGVSGSSFGEPMAWSDPRTVRVGGRLAF